MAEVSRRRRRSRYEPVPARLFTTRRLAALSVATVLLLAGVWVARVALALTSFGHVSLAEAIGVLIGHGSSQTQQQLQRHDRVNIALFGYGGGTHDGAYLSDSIMLVSIQQRDGKPVQVAEVSVPRDWWVPIDLGNGQVHHQRINEAFSWGQTGYPYSSSEFPPPNGGGRLASATLERLLGVHVDHYVGLDFRAFEAAVDAVGGVDVQVPNAFTDRQYPHGECSGDNPDCSLTTIHFDAGRQHMDGATALEFTRSRHADQATEASDFARSRRQQLVLAAIKQKALTAGGIGNLPDLLGALNGHISTDMNLADEKAIYDLVKEVDPSQVTRVSLDDTNFLYQCTPNCDAAVLFPHDRSYTSLQRFTQHILLDPEVLQEHATVTVVDASGRRQGASARWAALLHSLGLTTVDGGTAARTHDTSVIAPGGQAAHTAAWLGDYFTVSPDTSGAASGGGLTLVLGSAEEELFNNDTGDALHD